MIFNQFEFLFLFLPAVVVVSLLLLRGQARIWSLIVFSFLFYGMSGATHAAVLLVDIVWVFAVTSLPRYAGRPLYLALAVAPPVAALIYFKYFGFLIEALSFGLVGDGPGDAPFFESAVLPAGISFFTFQLLSYAIDRYRSASSTRFGFAQFALYVSFFPQLVAGPIVRAEQIEGGLRRLGAYRAKAGDLAIGLGYIVFGLAWKVLIADGLARLIAPLVETPGALTSLAAGWTVLAYSFQIYFDFYGYSLVAIGLARWFGIVLPDNFLRPYSAANPKEFWRRWHVTLSYWIRDYLYIPLGGSLAYARNILITFAICGLWHGAAWTFVAWGLYHAVLVILYGGLRRYWDAMPWLAQVALTFALVSLGWVFFIFDFAEAALFFGALLGQGGDVSGLGLDHAAMLAAAALVCFGVRAERIIAGAASVGPGRAMAVGAGLGLMFFATLLFVDVSQTFIYFRF